MAFQTALSGLNAASTDLAVTGNNVANVSTTGFKKSRTEFVDVYASNLQGISATTPGSGVRVSKIAQQFAQGNVEFTDNSLDLAINGEGFFVLSNDGSTEFTRAGAFHVDREANVVNHEGRRLQVFPPVTVGTNTTFNYGALSDLQLTTSEAQPQATSNATILLNLDAGETAPLIPFNQTDATSFNHSTSMTFYDSLGVQHTGTMYYVKTATPNQWDAHLYIDGVNATVGGNPSVPMNFTTDGLIASVNGNPAGTVTYDNYPITGAADLAVSMDYLDSTQFGTGFSVNNLLQDGFASGKLNGLDVSQTGVVFARFTNGTSKELGQVIMAKFPNEQGLSALGNTNWAETFESGDVNFGVAGTSDFGSLQSGALESSNVDLSEQLVNMIIAQRNFQANAQMITTEDSTTQTVINIR